MDQPRGPVWEERFRTSITARREQLGMSQNELARRLSEAGLPFRQQMIQRLESGERAVRLNEAMEISGILGLKLDAAITEFYDSNSTGLVLDRTEKYLGELDQLSRDAQAMVERLKKFNQDVSDTIDFLADQLTGSDNVGAELRHISYMDESTDEDALHDAEVVLASLSRVVRNIKRELYGEH